MKAEERARQLLKADGLIVYEPGQHSGPCKSPYVVVCAYGTYQTIQSTRLSYTLLVAYCYVPLTGEQTATLSALCDQVKRVMRAMRDQAKFTGREGPDMVEEDWKALSRSIEYQIMKRS